MANPLEQIQEGMKVYDRSGALIGRVDTVRFSDQDPDRQDPEVVEVSPIEDTGTLIDAITRFFRDDELPDEVRERLLLEGFVRIDARGLLEPDRYALTDQVQSVTADRVTLNVNRAELIPVP